MLQGWKDTVECCYEQLKFEIEVLESEVQTIEQEVDIHDFLEGAGMDSDDKAAVVPKAKATDKLDPFSGMMDTRQYILAAYPNPWSIESLPPIIRRCKTFRLFA